MQKADCRLCCVIAVRYDIIDLTHMVQAFGQADIVFSCDTAEQGKTPCSALKVYYGVFSAGAEEQSSERHGAKRCTILRPLTSARNYANLRPRKSKFGGLFYSDDHPEEIACKK